MRRILGSLERSLALLNAIGDGITAQEVSGKLIYANDAAARLCGYASGTEMLSVPRDQILQRFEILNEDGGPADYATLPGRLVISGKEVPEHILRYRVRATGEDRWSAVKAYPVLDADGKVEFSVSIIRDITDKKKSEFVERFLVDAGKSLTSSLDYETTLANVAKLATPIIADWCAIDLIDGGRDVHRVAVAHVDPEMVQWAYELQRQNPPNLDSETGLGKVVRTGESDYYPALTDEDLLATAETEETREVIRQLRIRSAVVVPLTARGRILGAITLVTTADSGRHFSPDDLALAEELGRTAGLAIDNAQLFHQAQAERERFEVTLSSIGDAVIATDATGHITFMNDIAQQLTGWMAEAADQKPITEVFRIVNENTRDTVESPVDRVLREGVIVGLANHTILLAKDGQEVPIDDSGAPIRDTEGKIGGVVLVFRDITERRTIEHRSEELLQLERHTRQTLQVRARHQSVVAELGQKALVSTDLSELMNEAVTQLAQTLDVNFVKILELLPGGNTLLLKAGVGWQEGYVGQATVGAEMESQAGYTLASNTPIIVEDLRTETRFSGPELLLDHNVVSGMSVIIHGHEGAYGVLGVHSRRRHNFSEEDVYFLQSVANVIGAAIEQHRAYEFERAARLRAEAADQLKLKFLAMVSHELRTPLTSIKGFATTLLADDVDWEPGSQREFIEIIDAEADKLTELIEQLLDISRMEAGTLRIDPAPHTVSDLVEEARPQLERLADQHQIVIHEAENLPSVLADDQRIIQVLCNLVENASKYSPEGTRISVSATHQGDFIQFDVADQGVGIPTEERPHVMEAFRQVPRKEQSKGAGLGLAICKGLVEAHGGHIWIQDQYPGTTISFTLPVARS